MGHVLLIEDDLEQAALYQKYLVTGNHTYVLASTGREGVSLAISHAFDLVILDLGLPDMKGLAVLKQIRDRRTLWDLPIIILTAAPSPCAGCCFSFGADDFALKPVGQAEFLARIQARFEVRAQGEARIKAVEREMEALKAAYRAEKGLTGAFERLETAVRGLTSGD